jgi:hypothetical protein
MPLKEVLLEKPSLFGTLPQTIQISFQKITGITTGLLNFLLPFWLI